MELVLPSYKVTRTTSTDDLRVLENLYSEVGGFASTILDRRYIAFSKECAKRLCKVSSILHGRIEYRESQTTESQEISADVNLSALTIDELYDIYRRRPERIQSRIEAERELTTFYYEGKIIRELSGRETKSDSERLKIDYCLMTYYSELENMSLIFSVPVNSTKKIILPEERGIGSAADLSSLIRQYRDYASIEEREVLIEYVDMALDRMLKAGDKAEMLRPATEIAEIGRRGKMSVPDWVIGFLSEAIKEGRKDPRISDTELVAPLLALHLHTCDNKLEREAGRIINRCYRRCTEVEADSLSEALIDSLYVAVTYSDYVSRFSVRKIVTIWNRLMERVMDESLSLTAEQGRRLQFIASELAPFAKINSISL